MRVLIVMLCLSAAYLGNTHAAVAYEDSPYLAVSAAEPEGVHSVRNVWKPFGYLQVGLMGGRPFTLRALSSYTEEPDAIRLALNTGEVLTFEDAALEYTCKFFFIYYGLVIAEYPDGGVETLAVRFYPAWRPEEVQTIPQVELEQVKPQMESEEQQHLVDIWWADIVEPGVTQRERERARERETNGA